MADEAGAAAAPIARRNCPEAQPAVHPHDREGEACFTLTRTLFVNERNDLGNTILGTLGRNTGLDGIHVSSALADAVCVLRTFSSMIVESRHSLEYGGRSGVCAAPPALATATVRRAWSWGRECW